MAKISKQLGTVIGCWAVALVFVITGVCLALTIPSKAAEVPEGEAVVMFVDYQYNKTIYYDDFMEAVKKFNKPGYSGGSGKYQYKIKLMADISIDEQISFDSKVTGSGDRVELVLDLNGHLLTCNNNSWDLDNNVILLDSRPDVEHILPNGEVVHGGTIFSGRITTKYTGNLTVNGGNYCGAGAFLISNGGQITMNAGNITWSSDAWGKNNPISVYLSDINSNKPTFVMNGGYLADNIYIHIVNTTGVYEENEYLSPNIDAEMLNKYVKLGAGVTKRTDPDTGKTYYQGENIPLVNACEHYYSNWVVDVTPTWEEEGNRHHTCNYCGEYEAEVMPRLDANDIGNTVSNDGKIVVTFNGKTDEYTNMAFALGKVQQLSTTAENPAFVKLQSNVTTAGISWANMNNCVLDLNGYIWSAEALNIYTYNPLNITDSRPNVLRYCSYMGTDEGYQFASQELIGHASTKIYGGVITTGSSGALIAIAGAAENETYNGQIIIDGGTILGTGLIQIYDENPEDDYTAKLVLNNGNLQLCTNFDEEVFTGTLAVMNMGGEVEINGGRLYGEIVEMFVDDEGNEQARVVDLNNLPADSSVKINADVELKTQYNEDGSIEYYEAVNKNAPVNDQAVADNNSNMAGLIVLGAAAAVTVVGVTTVISVAVKRRKKAA